jgi:hypothetical protein
MGSISGKCNQNMAFIDTVIISERRLHEVKEIFTSMVKKQIR